MEDVIPKKYVIRIIPNMETEKFEGVVDIVAIAKPTKEIVINAKELEIKKAFVECRGTKHSATVKMDKAREQARIMLENKVSGDISIHIEYRGVHNENMYGFYVAKYTARGKESKILTTQFESSNARAALPCFDEPKLKAIFELTLVVDKELDAISNMPVKSTSFTNGKKEVSFYPTPKMSTYLLYMGVGKFEYLSGKLDKLKIRVITVPGKIEYAKAAMDYTRNFVAFYEKYFGIKYPLPKLDMIAIPDFAAGAMENWGAITFRETAILYDPKKTTVSTKRNLADTIAHELAHQWFGDLVTMEWWDDIWLNESFATYMSYKAIENVYPEWKMDREYLVDVVESAFAIDQLHSTHPISVKVNSPAEIESIFDEISYEKGGTVLRMIENYVGSEVFRKGLHNYLLEHAYANATKYDLWNALDAAAKSSGKAAKVKLVASAWINLPGYPIVNAKRNGTRIMLSQKRVFIDGKYKESEWPIPINYAYKSNGKVKIGTTLMQKKEFSMNIGPAGWFKLNKGQTGLYRVAYDNESLKQIGIAYKSSELDEIDAWGVESDLYAFVRVGAIKVKDYLTFVESYLLDAEYPTSLSLISHLRSLYFIFNGTKVGEEVKRVSLLYFESAISRIGWLPKKGEDEIAKMLRGALILGLGILGENKALELSKRLFGSALSDKGNIDPNVMATVISLSAFSGNASTLSRLENAYVRENFPGKKRIILNSLGMFNDRRLVSKALQFSLSSKVRLQDSFNIPVFVSGNVAAKGMLWPWIKKNWRGFIDKYDPGTHMLARFVSILGSESDENTLKDIKRFFSSKANARDDMKKDLAETIEFIESNIRMLNANR
ncbi:MAG: M1 family metallopeptidase [Candidatus Micrarchaeia archaeon]